MAIVYQEFDSTPPNVIADIVAKMVAGGDWVDISPAPTVFTTAATVLNSVTTMTVSSTAGLHVGQHFDLVFSGITYTRVITAINSATSLSFNSSYGTSGSIPSGTTVTTNSRLLKCTNSRGGQMYLELQSGHLPTGLNDSYRAVGVTSYLSHTGATWASSAYTGMSSEGYIFYSGTLLNSQTDATLHVVVSSSKEHAYISIEGPRNVENYASSTTFGSLKNYAFIADIVPYHATVDLTPAVAFWANFSGSSNGASPTLADQLWRGIVSRTWDNDASWVPCRFPTITMPHMLSGAATSVNNWCEIDQREYTWPYLVVEETDGLRGRLNNIFHIGVNRVSYAIDNPQLPGNMLVQGSTRFKKVGIHKGDGSRFGGAGGLGWANAISNSNDSNMTIVIAVPHSTVT